MSQAQIRLGRALLVLLFMLIVSFQFAIASPFVPPTEITVRMYRLRYPSGAIWTDPVDGSYHLCIAGDVYFGCTAFDNDSGNYPPAQQRPYPYPFNPTIIPVETDYLLDVVPQEIIADASHPMAVQAQAIAARSYAYSTALVYGTINNSTDFQAFIPYKFESLLPTAFPDNPGDPCASTNLNANQKRVCDAVAPSYYISYGTASDPGAPAFSEFFGDIPNRTLDGGLPYELSVADPISSHPDIIQDGHGHGMSQHGASRWAYGNLGYRGNLDDWSVQWVSSTQILTHYYAGIHLRDADGVRLTSDYRWNPLSIDWGTSDGQPPVMVLGKSYPVTIVVQNTGTLSWTIGGGATYRLSYLWTKGTNEFGSGHYAEIATQVPPGDPPYTFMLTINDRPDWGHGLYTLKFDMAIQAPGGTYWFHDLAPGWLTYDVDVYGEYPLFLPMVTNGGATSR